MRYGATHRPNRNGSGRRQIPPLPSWRLTGPEPFSISGSRLDRTLIQRGAMLTKWPQLEGGAAAKPAPTLRPLPIFSPYLPSQKLFLFIMQSGVVCAPMSTMS